MRTMKVAAFMAALVPVAPAMAIFDGSNLIVNPGAEDGPASPESGGYAASIPGWTIVAPGAAVAEYSDGWYEQPGGANPNKGQKFFYGGSPGSGIFTNSIFQVIDVSSEATLIDTTGVNYTISGWFGGWNAQTDTAGLTATFLDGSSQTLGALTIGNPTPTDRGSVATMLPYSGEGVIPVGTRSIRLQVDIVKAAGGSANDGAADSLVFSGEPVPEPATLAALGLGVAALLRRRRK